MKKIITALLLAVIMLLCCLQVYAADGNVTYGENASGIVFAPGSDRSLTDLFPNFKGVMPGDDLTQTITLKNSAASGKKIDIYMRAQSTDEASAELLSQLILRTAVKDEQSVKEIFHAAPSDTSGLDAWVLLGTLESGGSVDLELSLSVPVEMDNTMQDKIGTLNWEFRVYEFSVDGMGGTIFDNLLFIIWLVITLCAVTILILILCRKKDKEEPDNSEEPLNSEEAINSEEVINAEDELSADEEQEEKKEE